MRPWRNAIPGWPHYREALEAGADPAVVAAWIGDVQTERRKIEHELRGKGPAAVWSPDEIRSLVKSLGDLVAVLGGAQPQNKADLYWELGLMLTYEPSGPKVLVETDLSRVRKVRVGGGI